MDQSLIDEPQVQRLDPEVLARQRASRQTVLDSATDNDTPPERSESFQKMADALRESLERPEFAPTTDEPEPRKAKDWKILKEKKAAAEAKASALEAQLKSPPDEALQKALETERATRQTLENELKKVALEKAPEFKNHFAKLFDSAKAQADALFTVPVGHILEMSAGVQRDAMLNQLRDRLSGVQVARFDSAVAAYDSASADRASQLADAEKSFERLKGVRAEQENRERTLRQQRLEQHAEELLKKLRPQFPDVFNGDPENVKASEDLVRRTYTGQLTGDETIAMPLLAVEGLRAKRLKAENDELRATLAAYEQSSARPSGGAPPPSSGSAKKGFVESFLSHSPGAGGDGIAGTGGPSHDPNYEGFKK
jgi:hypothetical protein